MASADGTDLRRPAAFSRIKEIIRRQRKDGDQFLLDEPDLDFTYADSDSYLNELAELYSYSEKADFQLNFSSFESDFGQQGLAVTDPLWKQKYVQSLLNRLELADRGQRMNVARALLYVMQGAFDFATSVEELRQNAREFCSLVCANGGYPLLVQMLITEAQDVDAISAAARKLSVCLADNINMRICVNLLYHLIETMRWCDGEMTAKEKELREDFKTELGEPVCGNYSLALILFDMVLTFSNGTIPHFPIKKLLLLLWKTILVSLGGFDELVQKKADARREAGLPDAPPFKIQRPKPRIDKNECGDGGGGGGGADEPQSDSCPSSSEDEGEDDSSNYSSEAEEVKRLIGDALEDAIGGSKEKEEKGPSRDERVVVSRTRRIRESGTLEDLRVAKQRDQAVMVPPKVRQKELGTFVKLTRGKFVGLDLGDDDATLAGLPEPIHESVSVLHSHLYVSLGDHQIKEEEEATSKGFLQQHKERPSNPVEDLYRALLPSLPQYMIALLKILLAAAKSKTDSINILVDVTPEDVPTSVLQTMQLGIDVNRHKEIMMKAITALLLLLLKHFKVNHVYQFEFMGQHLVFANCIPLVLKLLNQNVPIFVAARNNISALDFPHFLLCPSSEVTAEGLEAGDSRDVCWRNLFSCINLLRILLKLVKWKHSRTVMLVVFKSAPILKRALKVRHHLMQFYILKLLKTQVTFLGRGWRRGNMRILSAIYQRVRHRIHDDWAFGSDMEARPWDFQSAEYSLRVCVAQFNNRHYAPSPPVEEKVVNLDFSNTDVMSDEAYQPVDYNVLNVLAQDVPLSEEFKENYEEWLEREVFDAKINWDELCGTVE